MFRKLIICILLLANSLLFFGCGGEPTSKSPDIVAYEEAVAAIQKDPWTAYSAIDKAVNLAQNAKKDDSRTYTLQQMKVYGDYLKKITDKEHALKNHGVHYYLDKYTNPLPKGPRSIGAQKAYELLDRGTFRFYNGNVRRSTTDSPNTEAVILGADNTFNEKEIQPLAEEYWKQVVPKEIHEYTEHTSRGRVSRTYSPIIKLKYAVNAEINAIEQFAKDFNKTSIDVRYIYDDLPGYSNNISGGRGSVPSHYVPPSNSDQMVGGYFRKNGTYVAPYMRSRRDGNPNNNFSHRGNVNPYTGKKGYTK